MSESNRLFMRAFEKWDKERPFSTFLFRVLTNGLIDFVRKTDVPLSVERLRIELGVPSTPDDDQDRDVSERTYLPDDKTIHPADSLHRKELLDGLSSDAKYIVRLLLEGPAEFIDILGSEPPKIIRGAIKNHLRDCGWKWADIWASFREIKLMVSQL